MAKGRIKYNCVIESFNQCKRLSLLPCKCRKCKRSLHKRRQFSRCDRFILRVTGTLLYQLSYRVNWEQTSILFPVDSISQLVEQRSGYPKMRARIPLKSAFLVDFRNVGHIMKFSVYNHGKTVPISYIT